MCNKKKIFWKNFSYWGRPIKKKKKKKTMCFLIKFVIYFVFQEKSITKKRFIPTFMNFCEILSWKISSSIFNKPG